MATRPAIEPTPNVIPDGRRLYNNYHFDYSPKRGEFVEFDGPLEYEFWVLNESDPHVIQLCPQPLKIYERINGRVLNYSFDLWTYDETCGEILWDVKDKASCVEDVNGQLVPPKWPQVVKWAEARNADVRFVTENDIAHPSVALRIVNWKEMLRHIGPSSPRVTGKEEDAIVSLVEQESQSIGRVLRTLYRMNEDRVVSAAVRLLHAGQLSSDVDSRPFNADTLLRVSNG